MKTLMTMMAATLIGATCAAAPEATTAPKPPRAPHEQLGRPNRMMRPQATIEPVLHALRDVQIAEKVGLTPEQRTKLDALRNTRAMSRETQEKMRDAMKRQADLMAAEKVDETAVMATVDEIFELRKETAKEQLRRTIAAKSILTPEQIRLAQEAIRENRMSRRRMSAPKATEAKAAAKPAAATEKKAAEAK